MNNFIRDYLVKLYIPRITWTDIIEIVIIAFVIYNVMEIGRASCRERV